MSAKDLGFSISSSRELWRCYTHIFSLGKSVGKVCHSPKFLLDTPTPHTTHTRPSLFRRHNLWTPSLTSACPLCCGPREQCDSLWRPLRKHYLLQPLELEIISSRNGKNGSSTFGTWQVMQVSLANKPPLCSWMWENAAATKVTWGMCCVLGFNLDDKLICTAPNWL
jgi:hypothetical protein